MLKNIYSLLGCVYCFSINIYGQVRFSLEDALRYIETTTEYKQLQYDSKYHELYYKIFDANLLPQIRLNASLPDYRKMISIVTQPDGKDAYVSRRYATTGVGLQIQQLLPFTGGTLTFSSNLNRLDNFNVGYKDHSYYFNLGNISYSQNLLGPNLYKWEKKKNEISKNAEHVRYYQGIEAAKFKIVNAFFNLLIAQREYDLSQEQLALSRFIYEQAVSLFKFKRISKEDLLEAEIEFIKSKNNINDLDLKEARRLFQLCIGLHDDLTPIVYFDDKTIQACSLNYEMQNVINAAIEYNFKIPNKLEIMNHSIELKKLKQERGPILTLSLGSGYNSQFEAFSDILDEKASSMIASLSVDVPLFDGNIYKNRKKIAEVELMKLKEDIKHKIENAKIEYEKDLLDMNRILYGINLYDQTLALVQQQLDLVKLHAKHGKVDMQKVIKAKMEQMENFIAYNKLIRNFYLCVYKYRQLALIDIRTNEKLY